MGVPYAEVIGDPVAHSKSPVIHGFWLRKLGFAADYRAARIEAAELTAYLAARRGDPDWRGCNLTMPLKEAILPHLDRIDDDQIGAINCVVPVDGKLVGKNSDAGGVHHAFSFPVDTVAPICIIGAGGAARAAFASLDMLAVYRFHLVARDKAKAERLLAPYQDFGRHFDLDHAEQALTGCVGAINATPLGMTGYPAMPDTVLRGLAKLRRRGFAVDLVYDPLETAFLAEARWQRLQVVDGLTVLIGQASFAFYYFFGVSPPREHDTELREALTS